MIVVQMHGDPGSGKSTLARAIGRELPAIVIDKDAISSALLRACAWPSIQAGGRTLAEQHGVPWALIELQCPDAVIDCRLATRPAGESQPRHREDWYARPGTARPTCERLVLDGTRPVVDIAASAVAYLHEAITGGAPLSTKHAALSTKQPRLHSALGTRASELRP
jgi:hypothetical protein